MKVIGSLLVGLGLTLGASLASANCWEECVLPNPVSGGCAKYVKVCDVTNPGTAAISLGNDIKDAENRIAANWHLAYGILPPGLRLFLDRYPITFACVLFPATRGYALAVAALESIVADSKSRDDAAAPMIQSPQTPDWKKQDIQNGEAFLLSLEIGVINVTDWNAPGAAPLRDKYAEPWSRYLTCLDHAQVPVHGETCFHQLKKDAVLVDG